MGLIILRCQFDPLPTALRRSSPAPCKSEALKISQCIFILPGTTAITFALPRLHLP
jgi:hypothetical protein